MIQCRDMMMPASRTSGCLRYALRDRLATRTRVSLARGTGSRRPPSRSESLRLSGRPWVRLRLAHWHWSRPSASESRVLLELRLRSVAAARSLSPPALRHTDHDHDDHDRCLGRSDPGLLPGRPQPGRQAAHIMASRRVNAGHRRS